MPPIFIFLFLAILALAISSAARRGKEQAPIPAWKVALFAAAALFAAGAAAWVVFTR